MHLLIPGALPPSSVAQELIPQVQQYCPALVQRLNTMSASVQTLQPEHTGCTVYEAVQLLHQGYAPVANANLGAGLAPHLAGIKAPAETVWLAELCAISVGREGASFAHPSSFTITAAESDALFDAVAELWANSTISVLPLNPRQWRVWLKPGVSTRSITPAAIAEMHLADWWPQEDSLRDWRRLINEIQMVWHEHPVNVARAERGEVPINSLWLFGGAPGWNPSVNATTQITAVYEGLHTPYLQGDWAGWIAALPALSEHLSALNPATAIILTGQQRSVTLTAAQRRWWQTLWPARSQKWNLWWNLQN